MRSFLLAALVCVTCVTAACSGSDDGLGPGADGGSAMADGGPSPGTDGDSAIADGASAPDSRFAADTFLPWWGGPSYYAKWSHGFSSDPSWFPITVWLQSPGNAALFQEAGIGFLMGLYDGPTNAQLSTLAKASFRAVADQSGDYASHLADPTLMGWLQPDEPDNAQPLSGGGYGPCIAPSELQQTYKTFNERDGTRPVVLGLGRGVADVSWVGRGSCTGKTEMYAEYAKAADVLAYDIYPVNEGAPLEIVATGVDNLRKWSGYTKPVIMDVEASNFNDTTMPSTAQTKSEVWMALVHGAAGIDYFCHQFKPTFVEDACVSTPALRAALAGINAQVKDIAAVLNTPSVGNGVTISSSNPDIPVDVMLKRFNGATYLLTVEMRNGATTATYTLRDFPVTASAEVLGEARSIPVDHGVFEDSYSQYGVHLYRITY